MSKLRRNFVAVLAVLFCALLCVSTALFIPNNQKSVDAAINSNAVTLVTKDTSSGKIFDTASLNTLFGKLTGNSSATYQTLDNMFTTGSEQYSGLDLYIKANKSFYDVVLDNKHWNPVYLSKEGDDIILTLWLADIPNDLVDKGYLWSAFFSGTGKIAKDEYSSEMYSASVLREYLVGEPYAISKTERRKFTTANPSIQSSIWKNFIGDYGRYIVSPNQVKWQREESANVSLFNRKPNSNATVGSDFINDNASDAVSGNFKYGGYGTDESTHYFEWTKDALWVPSLTETGTSSVASVGDGYYWYGIWFPKNPITVAGSVTAAEHDTLVNASLTSNQSIWSRTSGGYNTKFSSTNFFCYYTNASGRQEQIGFSDAKSNTVTNGVELSTNAGWALRPAFHLNLTKAYKTIAAPKDVENVYSGTEQKLSDLAQKPDWYTLYSALYGNEDKIKVEYPTGKWDMLNASTNDGYEIKVTIVDKDSYWWPDTKDPKTDLERTFKFKITKKPVKVNLSPPSNNKVLTGDFDNYPKAEYVAGEIAANDLPPDGANYSTNYPTLITKYINNDTGDTFDLNSKPTKPGHYTATAEIDSSVVNKNYEIITDDPTHPYTIDFVIVPYTVAKPTYSYNGTLVYNASAYTINISSTDHVKYTVKKDGVVVTAENKKLENLTDTSFNVVDAGVYTITFTIVDQYYAWTDTLESNGSLDNADYTAPSFTIKQKELTVTLDGSDNPDTVDFEGGEWGVNTQVKFKINVTGEEGDDKVILYVYYTDKDGSGETPASRDNDYYVILGQTEKGNGYKLYCKLADPTASGNSINANYYIDYKGDPYVEKPFTISTAKAPFKESDLEWVYKNADIDNNKAQAITSGSSVPYNEKEYTISLASDYYEKLKALGVKVEGILEGATARTNANGVYGSETVYTVTVKIVAFSEDWTFEGTEITFEWYIAKSTFKLSSLNSVIEWGFTARDATLKYPESGVQYEGVDGSIVMSIYKGLPGWLTPNYDVVSCKASAVGDHTAKILSFTSTNENYMLSTEDADWLTKAWKIIPRTLYTDKWTTVQYDDKQVTVPPELVTTPYSPDLVYEYFDNEECNGTPITDFTKLTYEEGTTKVYYVRVSVADSDKDNYVIAEGVGNPHGFEIGKHKEAIEITITAGGVYDGTAKDATVVIVKAVEGITLNSFNIIYYKSDNTQLSGAPINAGNYTVEVTLKDAFTEKYYIKSVNVQSFAITKRILEIPEKNITRTYDGTERDVAAICGLDEGWEKYIDITITLSGNETTVRNMGTYTVELKIKDGINKDTRNVEWNTESSAAKVIPQTVYITVEQLELNAKVWIENGYYSRIQFDEEDYAENFVVYKVYDEDGKEVDFSTVRDSMGMMFIVEVSVGEEHGDNVIIVFAPGITARYEFFTTGGQEPVQVTLPTIADLVFNGVDQTFVVNYGGFEEYIEIDLSLSNEKVLTQFDSGEYTIYFKIKSGKNAVWATGGRGATPVTFEMKPLVLENPKVPENQKFTYTGSKITATLNIDTAIRFLDVVGDITAINAGKYHFTLSIKELYAGNVVWKSVTGEKSVDWIIEKAKITVKWTDGDVPELDLPEEFKDLDIEYVYTDENGKKVSKDELEPGKKYTVTATLSDGSYANYEFVDDSGKTLKNPAKTDGFDFEIKNKSSSFPWWIIAVVAGLLLAVAAVMVVVIKKRQAADGDDYDDYYDDEYDFDEEIEEDDGDDFGDDF